MLYSIKLYTHRHYNIKTFVIIHCVLFISLTRSVNRAQFLNINIAAICCYFCSICSSSSNSYGLFTSMYASLWSHKLVFNIIVLNSFWLLGFTIHMHHRLISTRFFVLNLDSWFFILCNKFITSWFSISSWIMFFFFLVLYIFLFVSLFSIYFSSFCEKVSGLLCNTALVFFSVILLPINSLGPYAVFFGLLFLSNFKCIWCILFSMIKKFLTLFTT